MTLVITIYETAGGVYATNGRENIETPNHGQIKSKAEGWIADYLKGREVGGK